MRSKALSFLLSLSLMFCVGFGSSLTASAYTGDNNNFYPLLFHGSISPYIQLRSGTSAIIPRFSLDLITGQNSYYSSFDGSVSGMDNILIYASNSQLDFNFVPNEFDYYFLFTVTSNGNFVFSPSSVRMRSREADNDTSVYYFLEDITVYGHNDSDTTGFTVIGKLPSVRYTSFYGFDIYSSVSSKIDTDIKFEGLICSFAKGTSTRTVVEAINQQTNVLGNKIDSARDDIQQSIEDQYGGEPGDSFPVDNIITQHNEKMGVLSFSSDALMQVLGLLSPDQTLSSELVFPSMSLTIAGQRNKVQLWPEYRFDLNTLKQHWPDFVGIMQSLTTALVWIFVLRYCYRVFEKYFLAGGGS